jgi:hypothetical protein
MNRWSSFLVILLVGCIEPYPAPDTGVDTSILVVDGFINATDKSAIVKITNAVPLAAEDVYPPERGAYVTIHSENGDSFTLIEGDAGIYSASGLSVDFNTKYQLNIHTSDNRDIVSDYISVMQTPPIDSVTWRPEEAGVTILVNTHDESNGSRYYHWDYIETWEYHAPWAAPYRKRNGTVIQLPPEEVPYYCYKTVPSTKVSVTSTTRLSEDVVRDFPLTYMEVGSSRISVLYSILVRQRVIDKAEFEFLQALQRVTESVGGLFDSQPYEILGNVHSSDPSVPVLGYFSGGAMDEQRLFLRRSELPDRLQKFPYNYCSYDTACVVRSANTKCRIELADLVEDSYLVADLSPAFPGYTYTIERCADCRYQGGVTTKPEFWP